MAHPAPDALIDHLKANPREQMIPAHGFTMNAGWWNERLTDELGGPMRNDDDTTGVGRITRGGNFRLADEAITDESGAGALQLLWHSLHWGTSDSNRGNKKRIKSVTENPSEKGTLLRAAAIASRQDARAAFIILKNGTRPTIRHLGPGFLTKFLYFAGGGNPSRRSLIVDSRVLKTLNRELGERKFNRLFGYGATSYAAALDIMHGWAKDASTHLGRPVAGDEVERWAFGL
jgi:hypothetical protein